MRQTCIFSGSSHPALVEAICDRLGAKPAKVDLKKFSNGETSVEIKTSVRDQDVFIVQSGSSKMNDNVMELLIMINACKGGSAKSITAVMPYFPYSRQSKKKSHRGAITARMLANLMNVAGVNHVITIDLHASQMQGFFKCPVDNLIAEPLLGKWIRMNIPDWKDAVVVSKNPGGTKRVTSLADAMKLSFGVVTTDRRRPHMSASMYNSTLIESIILDGVSEHRAADKEGDESDGRTLGRAGAAPIEQDFATMSPFSSPARQRAVSGLSASRSRFGNCEGPSSPLKQSTRAESFHTEEKGAALAKILGSEIAKPARDNDGYEDPESDGEEDEAPRDVITGRLIDGHIVDDDDDVHSPPMSISEGSVNGNRHHSSEEDTPNHMVQSFMSTTSSRRGYLGHHGGLGGTGDATASDEEEESDLKNPEVETRVTLVGNVRDRPVLIVDDIIDKSGSWIAAAETVVKRGGATKVYCMATHGLFGDNSLEEMEACHQIESIIVTDAFPIPPEKRRGISKLVVLDISSLLSEAIRRNHHGESISQLYQHYLYD
ncbi:Hypothetical protein R9X50_00064000 [Acrodontium crateriforme]|uniref:Ribose-phosphate pyrophosphokinase 1 n=1 Tax=Acrodontium crateriforme TaxID=150365 RepID=A0AAQ3LXN3_9PEZI|nr:Hypothetical protein R9X50_00064000 [Acrodontium crateriforme]